MTKKKIAMEDMKERLEKYVYYEGFFDLLKICRENSKENRPSFIFWRPEDLMYLACDNTK